MAKYDLSIVVPAYKQEKTIVADLKKILEELGKLRYTSELICVVDGKVDRTYAVAQQAFKGKPNVSIVGYNTNKGKGHAVRYGMARSTGRIIAFIDAGMDVNPGSISMILEHFEWYKADIVIGSKRHPASKVNYPWQRRLLSMGYQFGTRLLFGLNVRDTQVGLKCYRREVLEKVLPRLMVKTYAFDIEVLAVANYLGFTRIFEAPVEVYLQFGQGSTVTGKKLLRFAWLMVVDTLAVFYRLRILKYYSDTNKRKWVLDPELNFKVNTI